MKLNIENCNRFAHYLEISSHKELAKFLGVSDTVLALYWKGVQMGYDAVRDLYNTIGEKAVEFIVDFEGGTIDEFKSKYICIGTKLY